MIIVLIVAVILFWIIVPLWRWYRPTIDIVAYKGYGDIFLVHDKWERGTYKGRSSTFLFTLHSKLLFKSN